jgi:ABC-type nitrate/sulfonate/bicarbonate transport system ATPase subunit
VLENVTLAPELARRDKAAARRAARERLPVFGLEGFADAYPATLSGGMRQRAALLRTIMTERDVLLLDEPFGALDALTRTALQEWLLGVWGAERQTVLFITHDVEEAVFLADRVVVMTPRPGRIRTEIAVPLPRPRTYAALVADPTFNTLKAAVLAALGTTDGR